MRADLDFASTTETGPLPAFVLRSPEQLIAPVIFASPHSGEHYPQSMRSDLCVPILDLRRTEDAFVGDLFAPVLEHGAIQIEAQYGRAYVDLNRDVRELDADMFADGVPRVAGMPSARVKAGLGCLPRVGASGHEIYRRKLSLAEGSFRLDHVYDGYHGALQAEIERLKSDWSDVVIIDCHSMPSRQPGRSSLPDIVLGDRFGSSCSAHLTSDVEKAMRKLGFSVSRNAPYAGGYTTRRYGRPRRGVHVLQIEINRSLYMNERDVRRSAGFDALQKQLNEVTAAIIQFALQENG